MRKKNDDTKERNREFWKMVQELGEQAQIIINHREHRMLFEYWSAEVRADEAEAKAAEEAKKTKADAVPVKDSDQGLIRERSTIPTRVKLAEKVREEYLCEFNEPNNTETEARRKIELVFQNYGFKKENNDGDIDTVEKFYEEVGIPMWKISKTKKRIMPGLSPKKFKALCETAKSNAKGLTRYAKKCAKTAEAPCPLREACIRAYAKHSVFI